MSNHYLMKYKGTYRVLPVLDEVYHDLPRDVGGNISHEEVELYIACKNGSKITEYGLRRIASVSCPPSS